MRLINTSMTRPRLDDIFHTCQELARQGGTRALESFKTKKFKSLWKADHSFVTSADTNIETHLRSQLATTYPNHGIWGEELGTSHTNAEYCWNIDPIDGTHNFMYGIPVFGTLISVTKHNEVECIAAYDPNTDTLFSAQKGKGALVNGAPFRVNQKAESADLSKEVLIIECGKPVSARKAALSYLAEHGALFRSFRKFGCLLPPFHMAATHQLAALVLLEMDTREISSLALFLHEAGYRVTNTLRKQWNLTSGANLVATHAAYHDQVLDTFSKII